jgi:hypothetical protein
LEFAPDKISINPILRYFHYDHLPEKLQRISKPFCLLASEIVLTLPHNTERSVALRKLLEAKDCAVRANVYNIHETARDRPIIADEPEACEIGNFDDQPIAFNT